jgi:hypothetical protein
MDKTTLIAALSSMGILANQPTSNIDLKVINTQNDGNHFHDFFTEMLFFDTNNEILKIKYFASLIVGSKFYKFEKTGDSSFRIFPDNFGKYSVNSIKTFSQMRNPKIGDIVYTVDEDNQFVSATYITSIDLFTGNIQTQADLDIQGNSLCYANGALLHLIIGQIQSKKGSEYLTPFLDDDSVLILKRPKSDYTADTYISTENIEGFEFRRFNSAYDFLYKR